MIKRIQLRLWHCTVFSSFETQKRDRALKKGEMNKFKLN